MRKFIAKKVMAFALAITMIVPGFSTMTAYAEEVPEVIEIADEQFEEIVLEEVAEPVMDAGISVASEDITAPVVSNVVFVEQGQTVQMSADGMRYIHFTFDAYDADGSALSAENSVARIYVDDQSIVYTATVVDITDKGNGSYEMTIQLNNSWDGAMSVSELRISDDKGNGTSLMCWFDNQAVYEFDIEQVFNQEIVIDEIIVGMNSVTLTDEVFHVNVPIEITLKSTNVTLNDGDTLKAIMTMPSVNSSSSDYIGSSENWLYYDSESGSFKGYLYFGYGMPEGNAVLTKIRIGETAKKLEIPTQVVVNITKTNTDKTVPVIGDIYYTANGQRIEAGAVVEKTDDVKIHIEATDPSGFGENDAWVSLVTDLQDASQKEYYFYFNYDETAGEFIGTIPVDEMYATEWYVSWLNVEDKYCNRVEKGLHSNGKEDVIDMYFIIRSTDGNVSVPTHTYTIYFGAQGGQWEAKSYEVTTGRVTTLQEALATVGATIPAPPVYEGRTFESWYYNDAPISATEKIVVSNGRWMSLMPKYDKAPVSVRVQYQDEELVWQEQIIEVDADYGDSVKDIFDNLDLSDIEHNQQLQFKNWELGGMFYGDMTGRVVSPGNYIGYLNAVYQYDILTVEFQYYNVQMNNVWRQERVIVDPKVDTYQDAITRALQQVSLRHGNGLTLVRWNCDMDSDMLNQVIADNSTRYHWVSMEAEYQEQIAWANVSYIDADGDRAGWSKAFVVPAGTTYQTIYDKVKADIPTEHAEECNFKEWSVTTSAGDDLSVVVEGDWANLSINAQYEKYPIDYKYSYLTQDYKVKTVVESALVDYDVDLVEYYTNLTLPSDALVEEGMKWSFDGETYSGEMLLYRNEIHGCVEYKDYIPSNVLIHSVDENNNMYSEWKIYYVDADVVTEYESTWEPNYAFVSELEDQIIADSTNPQPTGFVFEELVYLYENSNRYTVDSQGEYLNMPQAEFAYVFDKAVVEYNYPDGTVRSEVKNAGDSITLSSAYSGKEILWEVSRVDSWDCDIEGGTSVNVESPYIILYAYYTGDNVSQPSTPVTPEPTPEPTPEIEIKPTKPTPPTNTTEEEEPVEEVVKEAVKLEEEVVAQKVEVVKEAEEGTAVVVEMKKEDGEVATEVPVEILEIAKGKDVDIVLDMGGYTWTINGQDIPDAATLQAINLEVTLDTAVVPPTVISTIAGDQPTRQISLTHNGDFGFKASLSINLGSENAGQFGNLYYYDSNNKLVFMNAGKIDEDGNVELSFTHASDYIVVVDEDRTEEEMSKQEVTEDEVVTDVEVETESKTVEETDDSSGSNIILFVAIALLVVGVIFVIVFVMMKKKEEE